jgi:hypothetical protein
MLFEPLSVNIRVGNTTSIILASIAIAINIIMTIEIHTGKTVFQHIKNLLSVLGTCLSRIHHPK